MNNIRELRKIKGLSQKELADKLNSDQSVVSKWELGKALPETSKLIKLSEIFEVSIDYVLGKSKFFYPENQGKDNYFTLEETRIIEDYRKLSPALQKTITDTLHTFLHADNK